MRKNFTAGSSDGSASRSKISEPSTSLSPWVSNPRNRLSFIGPIYFRPTIGISRVHSRNISDMRSIGFFTEPMETNRQDPRCKRLKCVKNIFLLHFFLAFLNVVIYPLLQFLDGSVLVYSFGGKILADPASAFANDLRKQQK